MTIPVTLKPSILGWIALAGLNCILLLGYLATHSQFPGDFCAFYTGSQIYSRSPRQVYDLNLQRRTEQALVGRDDLPFYHPPYELLAWLPLVRFSFHTALWMWRAVCLILLALASKLLAQTLAPHLGGATIFIIAMAFFPVPYCLWMGQDSVLLLAIFAACIWFLNKHRDFMAGAVLGLGLFKLELVIPIAAVYFLWGRWRFLGGIFCSGLAVLTTSVAMVGYSGMRQLVEVLIKGQTGAARMGVHAMMMPNVRGLIALLPVASSMLQTIVVLIVSGVLLVLAAFAVNRDQSPERELAALVCFAILVSFHLNLHDLTLLLLPALVVLQDRARSLKSNWTLMVPVVVLFCTPVYLVVLGASKVAVLGLFVGGLWYSLARAAQAKPLLGSRDA